MNTISTETKPVLQKESDPKWTATRVAEFSLVLGTPGEDWNRMIRAICRINDCLYVEAEELLAKPEPIIVNTGFTEEEAAAGQLELVCCDAVSAVVRSDVANRFNLGYLAGLLREVSHSPEFQSQLVDLNEIPLTESGSEFADQFFGVDLSKLLADGLPMVIGAALKKARYMKDWGDRIGASIALR